MREDQIKPKVALYATTSKEFRYQVEVLVEEYLKFNGRMDRHYLAVMGGLRDAQLDLYRRKKGYDLQSGMDKDRAPESE